MTLKDLRFRVWNGSFMEYDITVGKFGIFYVNPSNNGIDENDTASLTPFTTKYPDDIPLMQFTGLTDKNGKEIYEGDIIDHYATYGHVVYEDGMFSRNTSANVNFPNHKQPLCYLGEKEIEVIGNIYENPNGFAEAGGQFLKTSQTKENQKSDEQLLLKHAVKNQVCDCCGEHLNTDKTCPNPNCKNYNC